MLKNRPPPAPPHLFVGGGSGGRRGGELNYPVGVTSGRAPRIFSHHSPPPQTLFTPLSIERERGAQGGLGGGVREKRNV
jgi:hypothetical protein